MNLLKIFKDHLFIPLKKFFFDFDIEYNKAYSIIMYNDMSDLNNQIKYYKLYHNLQKNCNSNSQAYKLEKLHSFAMNKINDTI